MRAIIQRVLRAHVLVDQQKVGVISAGYLLYLGIGHDDTLEDLEWMANKVIGLRIFDDVNGKMNRSIADTNGDILVVSQFTLFGNVNKGFRPSFNAAAPLQKAEAMYVHFIDKLKNSLIGSVQEGQFQARMQIESINDGPVTIWLDSKNKDY